MTLMTHDEYVSRVLSASDLEAAALLAHAESCTACRRDARIADRALASAFGRPQRSSWFEDTAGVAAVAAILMISILSLSTTSSRPSAPAARYRIVGGPAGVVAYTPTETIIAASGRSASAGRQENPR